MKTRVTIFIAAALTCLTAMTALADVTAIERTLGLATGLGANDLGDLAWDGNQLWVEGSGTINLLSGEGSHLPDWLSMKNMDGWGRGSISALWASGDTIIVSWVYYAYYANIDGDAPHGDGVSISFDGGETWQYSGILDLFPERADWTTPNRYTTIWDIAVTGGTIWCSTTAGFLLKSEDWGETWENIIPYVPELDDSPDVVFDFGNPNHHGQCVDAYGDTIWVGTFQGMNLSVDGGTTWSNFSWPFDDTGDYENDQWPGNFPVAVEHKVVNGITHVWVASQDYLGYGKIGICHTADNGATWNYEQSLDYYSRPWNISFGSAGSAVNGEESVFVATSAGLLASHNLGATWETLDIRESATSFWNATDGIASVLATGDTLWATSADGLARSTDGGATWDIFQGIFRVKSLDTGNRDLGISAGYDYGNDNITTYAFPNPFSPKRGSTDYGRTRIQYSIEHDAAITIKVYDYAGKLVREILTGVSRTGGSDYQEVWDGRGADGEIVPNGTYFYTIDTSRGDSASGKIMVLD